MDEKKKEIKIETKTIEPLLVKKNVIEWGAKDQSIRETLYFSKPELKKTKKEGEDGSR